MPKPKHWDRADNVRKRSQRQEKRLGRELGLRLHPNSGATVFDKSDASDEVFRFEMKTTQAKRVPVSQTELAKIWREAVATGLYPAVVVTLESMPAPIPQDWVLIEKTTFEALRGEEK